jgi:hypothetical protein
MSHYDTCPHGFPDGQCPSPSCGGRRRTPVAYHELIEWADGSPTKPGLYVLDKGPAIRTFKSWGDRLVVYRSGDHDKPECVAHLQLPEPPIPKPKRIEFSLFKDMPRVDLEALRGLGAETLLEVFRAFRIHDVMVPPEMEGDPFVEELAKAAEKVKGEAAKDAMCNLIEKGLRDMGSTLVPKEEKEP